MTRHIARLSATAELLVLSSSSSPRGSSSIFELINQPTPQQFVVYSIADHRNLKRTDSVDFDNCKSRKKRT